MAVPPAAHPDVTSPVGGFGTHSRPSPRLTEIPKDLGWGQEVGPGAIKWLPSPPPGLARLRDRARHKRRVVAVPPTLPPPPSALRRRTRRRGLGAGSPRRPGHARSPGASLDAAGASWCALRGAPQQELLAPQIKRRNGEKRQDLLGDRRLSRTPASDSAGVWHRRPRRKALAQLRAELHLSEDGNSPCYPAPRRAPRCHGTERRRHAPHCRLCPGGLSALLSRFGGSPTDHTLSPQQPSTPSSLTLPPVTPPSASPHPPQPTCFCRSLGSKLPLPKPPPLL